MKLIFVILFFVVARCVFCLQNVRLIFPESVPEGGVATLFCLFDLEGEPLYSVKWYRGNREIFRYLPKEKPRFRIFNLHGLYIDLNSSNAHRLTLLDIPKYLGGNFTCEVTADAPAYSTRYVTQFLQVVRNASEIYEVPSERNTKLTVILSNPLNFNMSSGTLHMCKRFHCSSYVVSIILILFVVK